MLHLSPPPCPKPGRIILLNGPSSSGKSALARQLQASLLTPFLILSSDQLVDGGTLPPQRDVFDTNPDNIWSWQGSMRPKFFSGFHRCIRGMIEAGNDVIVDHVVEYAEWWEELRILLGEMDVWLVGVMCETVEMERRERDRGDRKVGEGRSHLENNKVHEIVESVGGYNWHVDSTKVVTEDVVRALIEAWTNRKGDTWSARTEI